MPNERQLKLAIPKGRMFDNITSLFEDANIRISGNSRQYLPHISDPDIEAKVLKPQNIAKLVELGSHDIGFTGLDWIVESGAEVKEMIDLQLDPVRIIAAIPHCFDEETLKSRPIVAASEYIHLSKNFLDDQGYDYYLLRTFGATEAYPPEDADLIIDNTATGRTLKEHKLKIISSIMNSSTRMIANSEALAQPWKREKIEELTMLLSAVLQARSRVMLEMNVPSTKLEEVVGILPCMRAPTVAKLYMDQGYSVKVAVKTAETLKLIPKLKRLGVSDILEYKIRKVVT